MILESKYDIGDFVYVLDYGNLGPRGWSDPPIRSGVISNVIFQNDCGQKIRYRFEGQKEHWHLDEKWMFADKDELLKAYKEYGQKLVKELGDSFEKGLKKIKEVENAVRKEKKVG